MAVAFPDVAVSQSSQRKTNNNLLRVEFGNGYSQRQPDGINYKRDEWSVSWENLDVTKKDTVIAFLNTVSTGEYFTWTSPLDTVEKKFILEGDWSIMVNGGNVFTVQAAFKQVFDL